MRRRRYNKKSLPGKKFILVIGIVIVLAVLVVAFFLYFERERPTVSIDGNVDLVGLQKKYRLAVADRESGLKLLEVKVRQGDLQKEVRSKSFARDETFPPEGTETWEGTVTVDPRKLGLKDGPAELMVRVRDHSMWSFFRGNLTQKVYPLTIDTDPPKVSRMSSSRYIKPGGSGIVVYTVKGEFLEHGVRLNGFFHPGSPMPGRQGQYVAMIGLPYDAVNIEELRVEARDGAGNVGKARFGIVLKKVAEKHDRITIPDSFLDWKIPEFSPYLEEVGGDNLEKFLYINETVRQDNNRRIKKICDNHADERYWEGRFLRMAGKRMSRFADQRTYLYDGEEMDNQVHLGIDLASFRHADVEASNHGRIRFADNLGIYGNTVIIDHGLGVFSLYSHLSNMVVNSGDFVKKGEKIGATGTTGMAGGDHLHFSMLINGIFVDPVEWWDEHWIEVSILSYLR